MIEARVNPERPYQVLVTLCAGEKNLPARIAFLDEGVIRVTVDPTGAFAPYARPVSPDHVARIQAQPDESNVYEHPAAGVRDAGDALSISAGEIELLLAKADGHMELRRRGRAVMREVAPVALDERASTQTLATSAGERFFGGGTQNGRAEHAGSVVRIVTTPMNSNQWGDGGVASPSPFFWSSAGYGVLRDTFAPGSYDFASSGPNLVAAHEDPVFDAYLLVADDPAASLRRVAQDILRAYFKVTGAPAHFPDFALYLGHLNAYNRDAWSFGYEEGAQAWTVRGSAPADAPGETRYELGRRRGYVVPEGHLAESLNGPDEVLASSAEKYRGQTPYEFSARAVIDEHARHDMPLGWILPNDGYGAGYGHNGYERTGGVDADGASSPERLAAISANVDNLASFSAYANERGVEVGLWAQSQITPSADPDATWQNLRDFRAEVARAGVRALKTDEEWVGDGYSFGLNATRQGYQIMEEETGRRPLVLTLDGWAGTQRYAAVWSGDQDGTDWEYIRMHVPTYVGQGLSGNPNVGSDLDGIFGGNALVATRDFQWKALTPIMLDMDGWGSLPKLPYAAGDPHTGICRMYLKLKSCLMPYISTCAASASCVPGWEGNDDLALPMVRSALLADEGAPREATRYEFLLGDSLLVAPIYQEVRPDAAGNDVRNGIYLPGSPNDVWIDFFTGERFAGGQVLDGFDAPLWKLPLFVRAGAILPRFAPHNNPRPVGVRNPGGLDRTRRVVDFWPAPGESRFVAYEDDGVSFGGHVATTYTCSTDGEKTTLLAEPSRGGYDGYEALRSTTLRATVSRRPLGLRVQCGEKDLQLVEASDRATFEAADPEPGTATWLFEEAPAIETFAPPVERVLAEMVTGAHGAPRVSVRLPRANVSEASQRVVLLGAQ
ncbi:glycoside hydrolase family 31 protein [Thermophilibacter provencensis]|uniref:Glycoside hydrolase family 31 protein n=1 Tax=Thermophilibacter provencensis TaxID=1852386 RepID=A0ABT7V3Y4_9ACTN|nr:TIM-barrel domain-containing protein [Thermophilibacter provencensis]MDM8270711.1 glycoside hydrolase family 31 protein [Thermophilibacter provencensis]